MQTFEMQQQYIIKSSPSIGVYHLKDRDLERVDILRMELVDKILNQKLSYH